MKIFISSGSIICYYLYISSISSFSIKLLVAASSGQENEVKVTDEESCKNSIVEDENSDTLQGWSKRWGESKTRWHRNDVHSFLLKHGEPLLSTSNDKKRALVPLCGKTLDLVHLAKHNNIEEVVGVEGIQKAIDEFSNEHQYLNIQEEVEESKSYNFDKYVGTNIKLFKGNFFHFNDSIDGKFDMIWDRGSLVAINPKDRQTYVNVLGNVLKPGGCILTTTVDRTQDNAEKPGPGPPFSIDESDMRDLYGNLDWVDSVTKLEQGVADEDSSWFELGFSICSKK